MALDKNRRSTAAQYFLDDGDDEKNPKNTHQKVSNRLFYYFRNSGDFASDTPLSIRLGSSTSEKCGNLISDPWRGFEDNQNLKYFSAKHFTSLSDVLKRRVVVVLS